MYPCPNCKRILPSNTLFCSYCGATVFPDQQQKPDRPHITINFNPGGLTKGTNESPYPSSQQTPDNSGEQTRPAEDLAEKKKNLINPLFPLAQGGGVAPWPGHIPMPGIAGTPQISQTPSLPGQPGGPSSVQPASPGAGGHAPIYKVPSRPQASSPANAPHARMPINNPSHLPQGQLPTGSTPNAPANTPPFHLPEGQLPTGSTPNAPANTPPLHLPPLSNNLFDLAPQKGNPFTPIPQGPPSSPTIPISSLKTSWGNTNRMGQNIWPPTPIPAPPAPPKPARKTSGAKVRFISFAATILTLIVTVIGVSLVNAATTDPSRPQHPTGTPAAVHTPPSPTASTSPTATVEALLPFTVTAVSASVDTHNYTGNCSNGTTLNFTGTITVPENTAGGTVTYNWLRSDGTSTSNQTVTFAVGDTSQTVTNSWTLTNTDLKSGAFGEALHLTSPKALTSQSANYTANCQAAFTVIGTTASANPNSYTGSCAKGTTLNFTGTITIPTNTVGGSVTYDWLRSNGTATAKQVISFAPYATSQTVTNAWAINATDLKSNTYWEALQVTLPNTLTSTHAIFTAHCQIAFTVTAATASANPNNYTGSCATGTTLNFTGTITIPANTIGGTATYNWIRSDGTATANQTVKFAPGDTSKTVTDAWTLSATDLNSGTYWEALQVTLPNTLTSAHAIFTANCQAAFTVTAVSAIANPNSYTGSCANGTTLNFTGTITVPTNTVGGTVTYDWLRSDGTTSTSQTSTFAAGNASNVVTDNWALSATDLNSGTYWEELQVTLPNIIASDKADLTVNCQTQFSVNAASIQSITPASYTGDCTADEKFTFTGTVTALANTVGGTVTYNWTRSDGTATANQTVTFAAGDTSKTVVDIWTLYGSDNKGGTPLTSGTYGETLKVTNPNAISSDAGTLTVNCQASLTVQSVSATSDHSSYNLDCNTSDQINPTFTGTITGPDTAPGGTVTYNWTRSDGSFTTNQTVQFAVGDISRTVTDTAWTLSGTNVQEGGTYGETLKVTGPAAIDSKQANFTIVCLNQAAEATILAFPAVVYSPDAFNIIPFWKRDDEVTPIEDSAQ